MAFLAVAEERSFARAAARLGTTTQSAISHVVQRLEERQHNGINVRLLTIGRLYVWEFEKDGRALNVRVEGQFTSNDPDLMIVAPLAGDGLVFLPEDHLADLMAQGDLVACLADWCPPFPGYHLYFPCRLQRLPSFRLLAGPLRYRGGSEGGKVPVRAVRKRPGHPQ